MSNNAFIRTAKGVVVSLNGVPTPISATAHNFDAVMDALKAGDWAAVEDALNLKAFIVKESHGRAAIDANGQVVVDGQPVNGAIANRIYQMFTDGFGVKPYLAFLNNLADNPSFRARKELYGFLEACDLPITEDGYFLAYKMVRNDYKDIYTGKMDNSVGKTLSMPRPEVDDDSNRTCSSGLHFCSEAYLSSGYGRHDNGDRVMVLKINPRDVVSIPVDYNNSKGRACRYEIVGELANWSGRLPADFTPHYNDEAEFDDSAYKFDADGYDAEGYDVDGYDRDGYDRDGFDEYGYDEDGYDRDGFNGSDGLDREGYDADGYDENGYDRDGLDRDGFDMDGNRREYVNQGAADAAVVAEDEAYDFSGAKITPAIVRDIRKMLADGWTLTAIADAKNISRRQVARIRDGQSWAFVK
jgi:hypothetical protein